MEINRISNGFPVFKLLEATFLTSLGTFGSSIGGTVSLSPGGVVSFPGGFVLLVTLVVFVLLTVSLVQLCPATAVFTFNPTVVALNRISSLMDCPGSRIPL